MGKERSGKAGGSEEGRENRILMFLKKKTTLENLSEGRLSKQLESCLKKLLAGCFINTTKDKNTILGLDCVIKMMVISFGGS